MVSTAVLGVPSVAPPVGALNPTFTVSFPSTSASSTIGMVTVLLAVSPAAKLTVWRHRRVVGGRGGGAVAGRQRDTDRPALPPVRVTVIVAVPPLSATL